MDFQIITTTGNNILGIGINLFQERQVFAFIKCSKGISGYLLKSFKYTTKNNKQMENILVTPLALL
jgi:hypothetical protein